MSKPATLRTALNAALYQESWRILAEAKRRYLLPLPGCRCAECHYRRAYLRMLEQARPRREKARARRTP
jgi:hypothetical protein